MKFLRHLSSVVLAVAVIVGLGMLWAHASGSGTGIGSGFRRAPSREALLRLEQIKAGVIRAQSGNAFHLADTGDLIRTCVIEAVLAAVVITVSAARRRYRRMRRTAARALKRQAAAVTDGDGGADDELTMVNNSGAVKAQPGPLNGSGNGFSVTWKRST